MSLTSPLCRPLCGPVATALSDARVGGGYNPGIALAGKTFAWHTAYDRSYMTVNSDGSGGVPAVGGTVGRLTDRSGGGFHMLQATSAARPVAKDGYLAFSHQGGGTRKSMATADASYGGTGRAFTMLLVIDCKAIPSDSIPATYTLAMTSPYVWPTKNLSMAVRGTASGFEIWVNGTQFTAAALANTALASLFLGCSAGDVNGLSRFYEQIVVAEALNDNDFNELKAYGLRQAGVAAIGNDVLVAFGDSRTYGTSSVDVSPWIMLTTALPTAKKYNEGVGGSTIASPPISAAAMVTKYPIVGTNTVVMWIGRNDIDSSGATAATTYGHYSTYAQVLHDAGWRVVVCTEVDLIDDTDGLAYSDLIRNGSLGQYAHAIADLYADVRLQNRLDTTYFADGVHLTDAGNAVVSEVISAAILTAVAGPHTDFTGTPLSGEAPLTVTFTDTSTGSPTSWLWDFGDGNTSTSQNPTHQYAAIGQYTVTLTATNASGSHYRTRTNYVNATAVLAPPASNMALWFKKNTASGSTWPDASGNSRDLTLTGSPTISGGSVTFNGTNQYGKTASFTLNSPVTVYMRVKVISWTSGDTLCDGDGAVTFLIYQTGSTPSVSLYSAGGPHAPNGDLTVGTKKSIAAGRKTNGTDYFIQVSGGSETNATATAGNLGGFTLAAQGDHASRFANIEVFEVIVYNVAHNTTERAAALAYLDSL